MGQQHLGKNELRKMREQRLDFSGELVFRTSRSGGKGGQHVNKVETQVELRWQPESSLVLNDQEKERVLAALRNRLRADGWLILVANRSPSQIQNKREVINRFNKIVRLALLPPQQRIATKKPRKANEKRLQNKKRRSETKANRKNQRWD